MVSTNNNILPFRVNNNKGFTVVGLGAIAVCIAMVVILGILLLRAGKRAACEITAKHL